MTRVAAIHQPNFLPWLGYFSKMAQCDVFILLDHVQLSRGSYTNRVKIKTHDGTPWLTVPFRHSGDSRYPAIRDVEIDYRQQWVVKHLRTLSQAYARAPHAASCLARLTEVLTAPHASLAALNEATIALLAEALGVDRPVVRASDLSVSGHRNELLVAICRVVGADTYLVGQGGGLTYMDDEYFAASGVTVRRQTFSHPTYQQLHGDFVPGLSALDLVLNEGPNAGAVLFEAGDSSQATI
ncbi:MAG: WbqC family protein [Gemmatimonadaceae bacterium]